MTDTNSISGKSSKSGIAGDSTGKLTPKQAAVNAAKQAVYETSQVFAKDLPQQIGLAPASKENPKPAEPRQITAEETAIKQAKAKSLLAANQRELEDIRINRHEKEQNIKVQDQQFATEVKGKEQPQELVVPTSKPKQGLFKKFKTAVTRKVIKRETGGQSSG